MFSFPGSTVAGRCIMGVFIAQGLIDGVIEESSSMTEVNDHIFLTHVKASDAGWNGYLRPVVEKPELKKYYTEGLALVGLKPSECPQPGENMDIYWDSVKDREDFAQQIENYKKTTNQESTESDSHEDL